MDGDRASVLRTDALALTVTVVVACGGLATVGAFRIPAATAAVALALAVWVGIASLFSP